MGETATTRALRATSALADAGDRQQRPDGDDRVRRAHHDRVRVLERLHDPRRRTGRSGALEADPAHRDVVAQAHEVVLKADLGPGRPQWACLGQGDAGAQRVVGHREQAHTDAAPVPERRGHRAQGLAGVQPAGAEQVRGQVAIAETKPVLAADPGQLVHHRPALAGHAPSGLPVVHAGQGVRDRVEVGADVQAVQDHVVADVDDGGDVGRGHDAHEPREHPGGPDAAAQGHQHAASIGAPVVGPVRRPLLPSPPAMPERIPSDRHTTVVSLLREAARVNGDVEAYVEPAGTAGGAP